jgi:hypothetical protein
MQGLSEYRCSRPTPAALKPHLGVSIAELVAGVDLEA